MTTKNEVQESQLAQLEKESRLETRLIPISDWHKYHPYPSLAGLRHIRFFCKSNGFEKAFVNLGRRVLINEKKFFELIAEKNSD